MAIPAPILVWLRDDLRLTDNPALHAAAERGQPIALLYLLDEVSDGIRPHGSATKWWLHKSLQALGAAVSDAGAQLILRRGPAAHVVPQVIDELGASAIFWNRRYATGSRNIDAGLKTSLRERGVEVQSFQANLLHEPWTVKTGEGNPFRVFTPFWRASLNLGSPRDPLPRPAHLTGAPAVASDTLASWDLLPSPVDWSAGLDAVWTPGEVAARERLEEFVTTGLEDYDRGRDAPAESSTSRLSPYLRFGEISPAQVWNRVVAGQLSEPAQKNSARFLSEIGWREFNWNILFHFEGLHENNFRSEFDAFPWEQPSPDHLKSWQRGTTGIPLVDAGMRELWQTGYMHNRVRMVTASFLIKNMLVDWRIGEAWFWDCLVDADEASNPANWQWVAGSGADAAPYFRVFNPELQAAKFDAKRVYQLRFIPELDSPEYPQPFVDLKASRTDALGAYEYVKRAGARQ